MSLYSNIQALGNRMATNLEAMGVSASFSDGGLTLADKILLIQHQTKGIVVSSEQKIAESGDDVSVSAYILNEDGTFVADGTQVVFEGIVDETRVIDEDELVWLHTPSLIQPPWWGFISTTEGSVMYMGNTDSNYFTFYKTTTGWNISYKDNATPSSITGNKIMYIGNGLITNGNGGYVDLATVNGSSSSIVSNWNDSYILGYIGKITVELYRGGTTTDGLANSYIDCTGAGVRTFRAFCGRLVSEIYEVIDGLFYDTGIDGTNHNYYYKSDATTYEPTSEYTSITGTYLSLILSNSPLNKTWSQIKEFSVGMCIEMDIVDASNCMLLIYYDNNGTDQNTIGNSDFRLNTLIGHLKVEIKSDGIYINGNKIISATITKNITLGFQNPNVDYQSGVGRMCKFKNLVVYSI